MIRHLDGAVVSQYALPAAERWQEQVKIAAKGAPLPGEVTATQTTVPFAVVVVAATGEIKASAPFDARVSPMTALKPGALVGVRVKAAAAASSTRVEQFFVLTVTGSGG